MYSERRARGQHQPSPLLHQRGGPRKAPLHRRLHSSHSNLLPARLRDLIGLCCVGNQFCYMQDSERPSFETVHPPAGQFCGTKPHQRATIMPAFLATGTDIVARQRQQPPPSHCPSSMRALLVLALACTLAAAQQVNDIEPQRPVWPPEYQVSGAPHRAPTASTGAAYASLCFCTRRYHSTSPCRTSTSTRSRRTPSSEPRGGVEQPGHTASCVRAYRRDALARGFGTPVLPCLPRYKYEAWQDTRLGRQKVVRNGKETVILLVPGEQHHAVLAHAACELAVGVASLPSPVTQLCSRACPATQSYSCHVLPQ